MSKVSVRGGFSDRNGIKPENKKIQLKDFDKRTRIQIDNFVGDLYKLTYNSKIYYENKDIQELIRYVIGNIYSELIDIREIYNDDIMFEKIHETVSCGTYDEIITLIEALIIYWDNHMKNDSSRKYYDRYNMRYYSRSIFEIANVFFKREYIGYRFVDNIITPISDDYEINTINETLGCKYQPVLEHISKANRFLADRENPDYENSIKESITAVEAMSEIITGFKGKEATLSNMLKKIEDKGVKIHGGLKSAFDTLYGYTSDANGIRHAGDIGGPESTFEEAKFMLVACCAFINYLIALKAD